MASSAATRPVSGSASASPQKTGCPRSSHATRPAPAATSSPKPTRVESRPAAVIDTQIVPCSTAAAASSPNPASARGRDDSITMSAAATSAASAPRPRGRRRVQQHGAVPGMQEVVEVLVAAAGPVQPLRRLHLDDPGSGQAEQVGAERPGPQRAEVHHEQASRGPGSISGRGGSGRGGGVDRRGCAGRAGPARSASSAPVCVRSQAATAGHGSSGSSAPTRAASSSGSSGRAQDTAAQPSEVGSSRVAPPAEIWPRRWCPVNAARSASRAAPSSRTGWRLPAVATASRAPIRPAMVAASPGGTSGGPSGWPVSETMPLRAQSAAAPALTSSDMPAMVRCAPWLAGSRCGSSPTGRRRRRCSTPRARPDHSSSSTWMRRPIRTSWPRLPGRRRRPSASWSACGPVNLLTSSGTT